MSLFLWVNEKNMKMEIVIGVANLNSNYKSDLWTEKMLEIFVLFHSMWPIKNSKSPNNRSAVSCSNFKAKRN